MKKRLIVTAVIAFGTLLAGCGQALTPTTTAATQTKTVETPQTTANPDLASTPMCDYNTSSVAAEAKGIAGSIPLVATNRNLKIANSTRDWVVSHIKFQNQNQPVPADYALKNRVGNDASMAALIVAMLRSDGFPAEVQLVPLSNDGFYGNSAPMIYTVMAWPERNHPMSLQIPYQHRKPQPLTDMGVLPW
jgi:hypothetical protein